MVSSLTELASGGITQNLRSQNSQLAASIAGLASGNRIVSAATDIAALSVATGLQSQTSSLRAAALNVSQGSSLLQVADGAASQIGNILDRLAALSTQANSGALSDSARDGLNAEFQGLVAEIDRLAGTTNFNNVNLIDGSLAGDNSLQTSTAQASQASGALNFTANVGAGQTIELNGVTLTEGVDFTAGATTGDTLSSLANTLNNDARFEGFTFDATNTTLDITADAGGTAGNQFTIDQGASTAAFNVAGDALSGAGVFSLQGGEDAGLAAGDTTVSGTVGDSLVASTTGQAARSTINFNSAADINAGDTIQIDNGEGGFETFTFVNGTPANANEIQIGADLEETLQNTADTLNDFEGPGDFGIRQLDFSVDDNSLVIENSQNGNATDVTGAALDINLGTTGGSITNTQLDNGSVGGIDVSGVTNAGFTGDIQGFETTFTGNNQLQISVEVGGETFTANVNNTNDAADQTVTFQSQSGSSFNVTLAGGQGLDVTDQAGADQFGARLDQAFSTISASQNREVTNFQGTGDLVGASLEINTSDFSNTQVNDISVINNGAQSLLEIEVNGQTFRSDDLGNSIGAGERITLTGDNGDTITFTNGDNQLDVSSQAAATDLQNQFESAIDFDPNAGGAQFQVGASADQSVNLQIGNLTTDALFGGATPDLLSLEGAQAASAVIAGAQNILTSARADIGAFQQGLDFAAAGIESAIQNQEAARSVLEDTDFASASTLNALLQAQTSASIATLAQTNRMSGNLLELLVE